ncbi:hypothetical protein BDU57DRAFT_271255 [Ampelomyces quisqualis]|uniref:Uncharacterized protein n=1 Tax=Ampelomyces quisqualis TaxID=50730 RepID=A0A6A5QHW7_AMPQU|nr:hypothetical protein BDU57DRAFT_271255 [Ampelomyces quisqualis]
MSDLNEHAPYLKNLLGDAKKGDAHLVDQEKIPSNKAPGQKLTAEQLPSTQNLQDILNSIKKNSHNIEGHGWREPHHKQVPIVPEDINKNPNYTNEPVYFIRKVNTADRIPHLPHAVSDIIVTCNKCTYYKECERHRPRGHMKTDISLCTKNHLRMALYWDIADPENRKGSWKLGIEEKFDRFLEPEQEKKEHEDARNDGGCKPQEPLSRVKGLAQRIIEDYNHDQADKARRAYLDPKGREYYTRPKHWGAKDPFEPAEYSMTRKGHEFKSADGCRVEKELKVLLQAWYKSRVPEHKKGKDRTTEHANAIWAEKVAARKIMKDLLSNESGAGSSEKVVETVVRPNEEGKKTRKRKTAETTIDNAKSTAGTKKSVNFAHIDDSSEGEITEQPVRKIRTVRTPTQNDSLNNFHAAQKSSQARDIESAEPSPIELAKFEKLAKDIEDEKAAETAPPARARQLAAPLGTQSKLRPTEEENKILQEIKKSQYVESDEEHTQEGEQEESEGDCEIEVPGEKEESIKDIFTKERAITKITTTKKNQKSTEGSSPPPSSSTKSKSKIKAEKRKAPTTEPPVAKKSRKIYKSAEIIEDSDEEADYTLPAAPALELSEQREGWKFAAAAVTESVQVVQTDKVDDNEVETDVVIERGTTIVKNIHETRKSEELETGGNMGDEKSEEEKDDANDHATAIEESEGKGNEPGLSQVPSAASPPGAPASPKSEHEDGEVPATPSPVGSPTRAKELVSPMRSPSEHSNASQDSLFDGDDSPLASASLEFSPTSAKRKASFAKYGSGEDDAEPARKKAKNVGWADDHGEPLMTEKNLSIQYILDEEESGEEGSEDEESESSSEEDSDGEYRDIDEEKEPVEDGEVDEEQEGDKKGDLDEREPVEEGEVDKDAEQQHFEDDDELLP